MIQTNGNRRSSRRTKVLCQRRTQKEVLIQRVALRLFQIHGFKKVSIREIAREADVSPVTIYNHYGSKEGLVREVVRNVMLEAVAGFRTMIEGNRPFLQKLEDIVLGKTALVKQYRGELVQRVASEDPETQEFIKDLYDREIQPMIVSFFNEGKKQGYVNPELSQEAILSYTELLRNGLMARPDLVGGSRKSARLVREFMTLYLYGLMGRSAK